jgi:hypothetical protein
LLRRICDGSIGRKVRNSEAPAALNMLPKFDEVAISTYLSALTKMRLAFHHAVGQRAERSSGEDVPGSWRRSTAVEPPTF